ncbi:MAG: Uma2 family endonuclease [Alphaproteobacteria bacterium]|nr:Uma2 family endonuclease [Alphaproteobacteria bacterium]
MSHSAPPRMTLEAFFAWYEAQPEGRRYELVDGQPFAMAAQRNRHGIMKANAYVALRRAIDQSAVDCFTMADGVTIAIDDHNAYEPDAAVQCGGGVDLDSVTLDMPTLVVEVLSPSSRGVDTGRKLVGYFRVASIRHYLVVVADRRLVTHHSRTADDRMETALITDGTLVLDPPGLDLPVAALFEGT